MVLLKICVVESGVFWFSCFLNLVLITDVGDYIEFYNHRRFHETLVYKKPMNVYQESIKLNQEKAKAS
ncbi:hypothetical protein BSPCLSOX_821 [uncultured Gammaproteobacteria bacterium]|nr:hypothetical protein BSPCLSOX_821 [uncultured Gammaproteobacteria bacterium]VVM17987.1 hypothetical protein BSPWISOXPB_5261 [uncultured Gammaproteobacteria bacterium]VVM28252.1 hypothetical protein BSPWISOXPB_10813 [uncultured Gammaproteobacteria bacterium]